MLDNSWVQIYSRNGSQFRVHCPCGRLHTGWMRNRKQAEKIAAEHLCNFGER